MKKFNVIIAGMEPIVVTADVMVIEDGKLLFKSGEQLIATFSYTHIMAANEIIVEV